MKYLVICLFAFSLFWAYGAQASAPLVKLGDKIKAPIEIEGGTSPLMTVVFEHKNHTGKGFSCTQCHHIRVNNYAYTTCRSEGCHETPGARDTDTMSMFAAFHSRETDRSCYGCHSKLSAENPDKYPSFQGCRPCHMSPQARAEAAAAK